MTAQQIYEKAEKNGVSFECSCSGISIDKWNDLMNGTTRADKKKIEKILIDNGSLSKEDTKYYNPYGYYKTNTHLIYVHSAIEYFYRIN